MITLLRMLIFVVLWFLLATVVCAQGEYTQKRKGCGIPIVVDTVQVPEPSKAAGIFYKYRQSDLVTTNQISNYTMMNRTGLPFSMLPAVGFTMQLGTYIDQTNDCVSYFFIGLLGFNGQIPGKGLASNADFSPVTTDYSMLYLDTGTWHMVYACLRPNYKSGMCDQPSFQVLTRARPDKMSADQLKIIDDITDDILAPYCYSSADINKQVYTDTKPFCLEIDFPPCIKSMVTALENQIKNTVSN